MSGGSDEGITPEAFTNLKNKVNLLEGLIQQLVTQNAELYQLNVESMMERIPPSEFGLIKEQLSTIENRLARVENISLAFESRTNEMAKTESTLSTDSCGGIIEEKGFGEIVYKEGKNYSNHENCEWTIIEPYAEMISFELISNGFEECCDYITVKSLNQTDFPNPIGPDFKLNSQNQTAYTNGSFAKVIFSADSSVTGKGFTLRFNITRIEDEVEECGGAIIGDRGVISYKSGLEYLDNERCVWILHSPNSSTINLTLVESGFDSCCDYLLVNTIDPETGWIRNDTKKIKGENETLTVEESLVVIVFYSDQYNSGNGFSLEFSSSGDNPDPEINFIVKHFSELNGAIEYPSSEWKEGGESNKIYVVGFSKTVKFPETHHTVIDWKHGIFQSSTTDSCVYDSLTLYETFRNGWKARARFPNQTDCQPFVTVPPETEILSFSHHCFIGIFKPLSHKSKENVTSFSFSYDNQRIADSICGGILEPLEAEFGQISYKIYTIYRNHEHCNWTVQVPQAKTIRFNLIQTGLESCCDHISVYSYNEPTDSPFKLKSDNRTVSVAGPNATVTFKTDLSVTGVGFLLRYRKET
ncbi:unnamed protein product [Orchesella dallaii]|uniref:CUB domain-containing protein n=1 Tax=Orchesella dallaii TaxID=48710 RepID=A0ABP1PLW9_9HEXA